jgi:integrase
MTKKSKGRLPDCEYYIRKHLTEDEIALLLSNCSNFKIHKKRNYWIVFCIYEYAMRASEICNLKWKDIDLNNNVMCIRRLKGSKDTVVQLTDKLVGFFYNHKKNNLYNSEYVFLGMTNYSKMTRHNITHIFHELGKMSGLGEHVHPHRLKHSNVTNLREKGMSIDDIQKSVGHKDIKNTSIYDHSSNYRAHNYFGDFNKRVGAA